MLVAASAIFWKVSRKDPKATMVVLENIGIVHGTLTELIIYSGVDLEWFFSDPDPTFYFVSDLYPDPVPIPVPDPRSYMNFVLYS